MRLTISLGIILLGAGVIGLIFFGIPFTNLTDSSSTMEEQLIDKEIITSSVTDISIDANVGSINIQPSPDDAIYVSVNETAKAQLNMTLSDDHFLKLTFNQLPVGWRRVVLNVQKQPHITLSLPDNIYNSMVIRLHVGDVTVNDVRMSRLDVHNHVGKVSLTNIVTDEADVEVNVGQIYVSQGAGNWTANVNVGNIDLSLLETREYINAEVNLGAIALAFTEFTDAYDADFRVDLGNIRTKGFGDADLDTNSEWNKSVGKDGVKVEANVNVGQILVEKQ
ncbi:hypothetical protein GCM10012290_01200 [Halolactibacillus alkaliphilus]|uniref:DUF4097 domain-containing protein n=1 Tax=Halolactibacillus alkaliphilus TaxID=442899 RepID=A0A511WWQ3_9BACI|nr:DUF4097 family beta strand repeat-containing protein [Halolactibacillus alkaliphilus]GEN55555.1 hypothetical protein HAL01_00190 [Halolactibacillus alkaliphilus]GGN64050.1 hypothetical protein GCM10012290_01200 [Halolactibacillus alkaliphilus]SFO61941.1 Putative adhesin [Halolactibacillus alkaliphilus]